jgi:catechol 2,3-dioxygenase-like lactoylglutathione lyase family enzyme
MKLNQVTLPASDLVSSIAFYEKLGFVLVVKDVHYARLENPSDLSTLSLEKRIDGGDGAHVYFECDDLDARVGP